MRYLRISCFAANEDPHFLWISMHLFLCPHWIGPSTKNHFLIACESPVKSIYYHIPSHLDPQQTWHQAWHLSVDWWCHCQSHRQGTDESRNGRRFARSGDLEAHLLYVPAWSSIFFNEVLV